MRDPGLPNHPGLRLTLALAILLACTLAPSIQRPQTASRPDAPAPSDADPGRLVALVPMGRLREPDLHFIADGLRDRLGLPVALLSPRLATPDAIHPATARYQAEPLLDDLSLHLPPDAWILIAVTDDDLTSADEDTLYGFADSNARTAVLSTARFRDDLQHPLVARRARARDQLIRAAVHEVAHLTEQDHCDARGCLMGEIAHRAQITPRTTLCPRCATRLALALREPRDLDAERLQRGDHLLALGLPHLALRLYHQTPPPQPTPERARYENRLGAALLSLERVAEGEAHLRRALELQPDLHPALYNLALVLAYAGEDEAAVQTLQRGMDLDADPQSRHAFAARFYLDALQDPGSALLHHRRLLDAGGRDPYLDRALRHLQEPDLLIFAAEEATHITAPRPRRPHKRR